MQTLLLSLFKPQILRLRGFLDVLTVLCFRFLKPLCKLLVKRLWDKRGRAANTEKRERQIERVDSLGRHILFQHYHSPISQNQKPCYQPLVLPLLHATHTISYQVLSFLFLTVSETKPFTPLPPHFANYTPLHTHEQTLRTSPDLPFSSLDESHCNSFLTSLPTFNIAI